VCGAALAAGALELGASRYRVLAREALAAGDAPRAVRLGRAAVRLGPWEPRGHLVLGSALLAVGEAGEALARFERLSRLRPHWISAIGNTATARLASGDARGALALFAAARSLAPASQRARAGFAASTPGAGAFPGTAVAAAASPALPGQAPEAAGGACDGLLVELRGTRLQMSGRGNLFDVLVCLSARLGFELDYPEQAPRPALDEIRVGDDESVAAVQLLLMEHGMNYAMSLSSDGREIRSLLVFGPGRSARRPATPRPSLPAPPPGTSSGRVEPSSTWASPGIDPSTTSPSPGARPSGASPFPEPQDLTPSRVR
jgi:hypothetical protein